MKCLSRIWGCFLIAGWVAAGPVLAAAGAAAQPVELVPAGDGRFLYEGRMDLADPAGPMLVWAGCRVRLDFDGPQLALRFTDGAGQNFFNAEVDGVNTVLGVPEGPDRRVPVPVPPGPGRHHLLLFKRSEAATGGVRFLGAELAGGAHAWAPSPPAYRLRMEFVGDSITVGACNEDAAADQWDDFRTHNHALSYAHLASQALRADHRALAVSGMGVATGWVEMKAGQIWDRLYPRPDSPPANLAGWQPDVVLVMLGENDDSFSHARGRPFPAGYAPGLVTLAKSIRTAYPRAHLVLLRGGMFGGARSAPLREAWTAAVGELEAADPAVSHFIFTHWSSTHPRVSDDRAMADELVAWLRRQPFMQEYL